MRDPESVHVDGAAPLSEAKSPIYFADLILDFDACTLARASGEAIQLTRGEFALLRFLASHPRRVLSRDMLLDATAGRRFEPFDRSVDVMVGRLRRKIEPDPKTPRIIVTTPGGYQFAAVLRKARSTAAPKPEKAADGAKVDAPTPLAGLVVGDTPSGSAAAQSASAERRPVTLMVCDLVGSTRLAATLDPEDWRDLVKAYLDEASKVVTGLGGHVLTRLGNELIALFGYPRAQENDAERAVRTALAIQRALSERNSEKVNKGAPEVVARVGLDCGLVVVDSTGEVFGDAANVAARVQALAEPGAVVLTANVHRQVAGLFVAEDKGARELEGLAEPVTLYRIVRASGGRRRGAARPLTPFIGREEESGLLTRRWERTQAGEGQFVFIVGEPGIGKSRLVEEFRANLAGTSHTWVEWSGLQLLQNTPLHPIAEWGRIRFEPDSPAEQRLADLENTLRLVGLDPAEYAPLLAPLVDIPLPAARVPNLTPEELRRRQLAAVVAWVLAGARSQAAAFAFEDLQWADPTSLDLMRTLAKRGAEAPLLIIATARPEFLPPWSIRSHHSVISLTPLNRAQVRQMVGEIASHRALSREVVEGVSERTGGVPLFVEEVTRLLLERGEAGGLQAIPPTLQQSLAARLDRLGEAREVAQIGAVLGRDFSYALLRALAPPVGGVNEPAAADDCGLQSALDRLVDADVLFVQGASAEATYRFKHALIQDAAYESLLKRRRQALHCRAGEILRDKPESAAAAPEVIAHHFTEAGLDDLAIEWWGKAGDQALRRSAFQEAIAHLGKAIAMADKAAEGASIATASARLRLQTNLGRAVMWSKGFASEETQAAYARARELAAKVDNPAERFATYYGQWANTSMRSGFAAAQDISQIFLDEAVSSALKPEIAIAHRMIGLTLHGRGHFVSAKGHFDEALRVYDRRWDQDARFRLGLEPGLTAMAYLASTEWVLGNAGRAQKLIEDSVAGSIDAGHVPTLGSSYMFAAQLEALRDDPVAALKIARTATDYAVENDLGLYRQWSKVYLDWARARLGEHGTGATELKQGLAARREAGYKAWTPLFTGLLAQVQAEGNQHSEALSRIAEALTLATEISEHWVDSFLHRIRGETLWKGDPGNTAAAEEAFIAAIAIARGQKARSFELQAALSLAKFYLSTGRPAEVRAVLAPALKGFSPTREMPEIAGALALMARLA
jgi:class 3 adenylate cyclase/tetratricopeptide (TPR) repeat protein